MYVVFVFPTLFSYSLARTQALPGIASELCKYTASQLLGKPHALLAPENLC